MDIAEQKAELRKHIRAKRRELSLMERELGAILVSKAIAGLERLNGASCILAYMPMKYELDILPAVNKLKERGIRAAFPLCVENGGLRLFIPAEKNGFVTGAYGILEPDVSTAAEVFPEDLDAILLPAIGFDREGNRLGQGGGFYDRLLDRTDCLKIAVGFDCQLVDSVPVEPTDKRVDIVVTPHETVTIR